MDMCRRAEFRRGEGMVVVESECGRWVVIRGCIRSFVESMGQGPECHN